jgi:hypothetical protein
MNQLTGTKPDGGSFVALVLEPGNIARLRNGNPVLVRIESLFPDGIPKRLEVTIHYSDTPVADARRLSGMADVFLDERQAGSKKPHCPECRSTVEQLGVWRNDTPLALIFCSVCGCILGTADSKDFPRRGTL